MAKKTGQKDNDQQSTTQKPNSNPQVSGRVTVPAPHVAPVVILMLQTRKARYIFIIAYNTESEMIVITFIILNQQKLQ